MHINWIAESLDTIALLSGKGARLLNVRGKRVCFVIWVLCCIYWAYIDIQRHLYAQALFTIPSIVLHVYGWWYWKKKGFGEDKASPPKQP